MTRSTITTLVMAVVCILVAAGVVGWLAFDNRDDAATPAAESPVDLLVRPDSHRLEPAGDGAVTFVEFLDFECEACRALFPVVEQLRADYRGRVTFVLRYFPIPSHINAERAARAVEAAARQGHLEPMYKQMYETQDQWGEQQTPKDDVFRGFARDLGLDLTQYDATYNDSATRDRIRRDVADGVALGVQGTPTFFIDGKRFQPRNYTDLTNALDTALAE
ncbi:MAG: thioredoxin domain-containing protein [Gordonia polyisoprenivorans]|nr:thioredoxin domain-containing protein [Gordonia polyisoprenivorans]